MKLYAIFTLSGILEAKQGGVKRKNLLQVHHLQEVTVIGETGLEPVAEKLQSVDNQGVMSKEQSGTARNLPFSPDLQLIIDLWPSLPENIKAAIQALLKVAF